MRTLLVAIMLTMLVVFVGSAAAQPPTGRQAGDAAEQSVAGDTDTDDPGLADRGPDWGRRSHRLDRAEEKRMRKHIEQLRMLKLLEMLDLREDQEMEFLSVLNRFRSDMASLDEKRTALLDSLATGLGDESLPKSQIYDYVDRIKATMAGHSDVMMSFMDRCREILTAQQYGELIVFQERFDKQLLERVRAFREGGHGGASPTKPPWMDEDSGR